MSKNKAAIIGSGNTERGDRLVGSLTPPGTDGLGAGETAPAAAGVSFSPPTPRPAPVTKENVTFLRAIALGRTGRAARTRTRRQSTCPRRPTTTTSASAKRDEVRGATSTCVGERCGERGGMAGAGWWPDGRREKRVRTGGADHRDGSLADRRVAAVRPSRPQTYRNVNDGSRISM